MGIITYVVYDIPDGRWLDLPQRGRTFVRELSGPPDAPALLLLHGLGATGGLNWSGAFGQLGAHFRVVALDQRGHGRGIRTRRFRLEDCADDAHALAAELGIDRCVVAGYSMGGPIAMLMWRRHRELVSGLVLAATSRNFRGQPAERLGYAALAVATGSAPPPTPLSHMAARLGLRLGVPLPWALDEIRRHQPAAVLQAAAQIGLFTCHDWVPLVDVPVAVVATTHDRLVPVQRQVRLASCIPSAVLHPLDAGHLGGSAISPWRFGVKPFWTDRAAAVLCEAAVQTSKRAVDYQARANSRIA